MRIASYIVFTLGVVATLFFKFFYTALSGDPFGYGYGMMLVGIPLILIGLLLFAFSFKTKIKFLFIFAIVILIFLSFQSVLGLGMIKSKNSIKYTPNESKGDMPSTVPQKNVFSASIVSGVAAPLIVQFTNGFQTAGDISVDYGDGTNCSTANPDGSQNCTLYTHTYTKSGTYTAILYRHLPTTELARTTVVVR